MKTKNHPSAAEVRHALDRVLQSEVLTNSPKLQNFLNYVVEQSLAGNAKEINGKAVAVDVYQRQLDTAGTAQNLVRVEARRLRRALEEYNSDEEKSDPVQIWMDAGSYKPRFEAITEVGSEETLKEPVSIAQKTWFPMDRTTLAASLFVSLLLVVVATTFVWRDSGAQMQDNVMADDAAKLAALRERSYTSVQAANLANQARGMFFPLFDAKRQEIALSSFQHVIDLDPDLPDGYAGVAQVLALLAYVSSDADITSELTIKARAMAEKGLSVGPTQAWPQAAMGWVLAVEGDTEAALRRARIAQELSPEDGHILDLVGLTAFVANDPAFAAEVTHPDRERRGSGRFAANNLWGVSQLMLENYPATIEVFSNAAKNGAPVSGPTLMLLGTAYHQMGNSEAARQAINEMYETWPDFPAELVAMRFFANAEDTRLRVLETLETYKPQL